MTTQTECDLSCPLEKVKCEAEAFCFALSFDPNVISFFSVLIEEAGESRGNGRCADDYKSRWLPFRRSSSESLVIALREPHHDEHSHPSSALRRRVRTGLMKHCHTISH